MIRILWWNKSLGLGGSRRQQAPGPQQDCSEVALSISRHRIAAQSGSFKTQAASPCCVREAPRGRRSAEAPHRDGPDHRCLIVTCINHLKFLCGWSGGTQFLTYFWPVSGNRHFCGTSRLLKSPLPGSKKLTGCLGREQSWKWGYPDGL